MIRTGIAGVCYMLFAVSANGQDIRINGEFYNITFPLFVQQVESGNNCHFYYKAADIDSFIINVKIVDQPLAEALKSIFNNTNYRYAIDASNHIFITKNTSLQTTLSEDFFSPDNKKVFAERRCIANEPAKKEKPTSSFTENKLFEIGCRSSAKKGNAVLTGFVKDIKNGEAIPGASVYIDSSFTGVLTDRFGYYSLTVSPGIHTLEVSSIGMKATQRHLMVYADGKLNIEMQDYIPSLKNVIVIAERKSNIRSTQMGIERLSIKSIKQVPVVFGEADILRVVLTLPGVTSVGEASTGFNVRGGSSDQNLILFDDATIYNPSHLLGFFSAFNPDVIKGVELYKSVIPVKYGGRLSSVLDVATKDGNDKKISGTGGIGLLTSKFTIEGPIKKR